eukprot:Hpha_TRINITY_DN16258_c4_g5::TRINITY_DN16258_c4_g5_i1::g.15262::m.15262
MVVVFNARRRDSRRRLESSVNREVPLPPPPPPQHQTAVAAVAVPNASPNFHGMTLHSTPAASHLSLAPAAPPPGSLHQRRAGRRRREWRAHAAERPIVDGLSRFGRRVRIIYRARGWPPPQLSWRVALPPPPVGWHPPRWTVPLRPYALRRPRCAQLSGRPHGGIRTRLSRARSGDGCPFPATPHSPTARTAGGFVPQPRRCASPGRVHHALPPAPFPGGCGPRCWRCLLPPGRRGGCVPALHRRGRHPGHSLMREPRLCYAPHQRQPRQRMTLPPPSASPTWRPSLSPTQALSAAPRLAARLSGEMPRATPPAHPGPRGRGSPPRPSPGRALCAERPARLWWPEAGLQVHAALVAS